MTMRYPHIAVLLTLLATMAAGHGVRADQAAVLRSDIQVEGDYVRLGDLFVEAGAAAERPVFRSPAPGSSGIVSAARLERAARTHGLVWGNPGRDSSITISRPGIEIGLDEIADAIREEISAQAGTGATGVSYAIEFAGGASSLFVDTNAEPSLDVMQLRFNERTGRFSVVLAVPDGVSGSTRQAFTGRALRVRALPVLTRPVGRGEVIGDDDLELREVPVRTVPGDALVDIAAIVGMAARRALRADQPLRERDVESPRMVERNTVVVATYRVPGLTITVRARALDDGALGDTIRVLNMQSNRIIETRIIGVNHVEAIPANAGLTVVTN